MGEGMAEPPFEHTARKHRDDFAAYTKKIADGEGRHMQEAINILRNKSNIGKADRETILLAFPCFFIRLIVSNNNCVAIPPPWAKGGTAKS